MTITGSMGSQMSLISGPGGGVSDYPTGMSGSGADTVPPLRAVSPSQLPPDERANVVKGWFKADAQHSAIWRVEAKEDFDFRAGDQWTAEDRALLNSQQRPHIVFNRVLTILKAIAGMEINGRHEVHFIPEDNSQTAVNELLSAASKWMSAGCDAEDEQSEAFDNCGTCGMGWTESRLDFEVVQKGKYIEESIDPLEMYWDRTSKKRNLVDARRMHRLRKMPLGDAMQLFPGFTKSDLDATWALGFELDQAKKTLEEKRKREENTTDVTYDDQYEVTIVHSQWWERETYYLVADQQTNTKAELTEQQWHKFAPRMRALGMEPLGVKMTRRVYHQSFLGSKELLHEKSPVQGRFIWACITGELNRTKGTWFGLIRVMRDPQMWANKWLSQSLHILNTTAKGGILAEKSAFDDERQAEETYARPDAVTWVADKAISGENPKIIPKPGAAFPQGHMELMQFAITAIRDVTGVNLELIGLKDVNQPGILEAMRKQAGMTVLATLFDSLRRFRKINGRIRLWFIQNFFADGRLIRVTGPGNAKSIPLLKDKCLGEYEVIVDDTPTSPNQKEANWAIIQPFLVVFKDMLAQKPQLLGLILEYSPLPDKLVNAIKELVQQQGQQQPTPQEQVAIQEIVSKIMLNQGKAKEANANAQKQAASSVWDIASAKDLIAKSQHDQAKQPLDALEQAAGIEATHVDTEHKRAQIGKTHAEAAATLAGAHSDAHKTGAEIGKLHADAHHKRVQAGVAGLTPIPHEPPPPPGPPGGEPGGPGAL